MADDSDDGSSATEEEDEPLALEDHISQWVLDENQAGYMEMSQSLLNHQKRESVWRPDLSLLRHAYACRRSSNPSNSAN
jgi:hypothetical protein